MLLPRSRAPAQSGEVSMRFTERKKLQRSHFTHPLMSKKYQLKREKLALADTRFWGAVTEFKLPIHCYK